MCNAKVDIRNNAFLQPNRA